MQVCRIHTLPLWWTLPEFLHRLCCVQYLSQQRLPATRAGVVRPPCISEMIQEYGPEIYTDMRHISNLLTIARICTSQDILPSGMSCSRGRRVTMLRNLLLCRVAVGRIGAGAHMCTVRTRMAQLECRRQDLLQEEEAEEANHHNEGGDRESCEA